MSDVVEPTDEQIKEWGEALFKKINDACEGHHALVVADALENMVASLIMGSKFVATMETAGGVLDEMVSTIREIMEHNAHMLEGRVPSGPVVN